MTQTLPDWLAKDALDIGLVTNDLDPMLDFWQNEIGLGFDHMLPLGGGLRQHRHTYGNSVFKLNHTRTPLSPTTEGGYRTLIIAKEGLTSPRDLTDPDGNPVRLVPVGTDGVTQWAITVAVASEAAFFAHYADALGLPRDSENPLAVRCGNSLIIAEIDPAAANTPQGDIMAHRGYRYTTLQVWKVDDCHAKIVARGGHEAQAPKTLGKTARISFVKDSCGNMMELSQRASITGSLSAH